MKIENENQSREIAKLFLHKYCKRVVLDHLFQEANLKNGDRFYRHDFITSMYSNDTTLLFKDDFNPLEINQNIDYNYHIHIHETLYHMVDVKGFNFYCNRGNVNMIFGDTPVGISAVHNSLHTFYVKGFEDYRFLSEFGKRKK